MMASKKDFELTKVEVVLSEFNRAAIDDFLKANRRGLGKKNQTSFTRNRKDATE